MEGRWEAKGEKQESDDLGEEKGNNGVAEKEGNQQEGERMTGEKREEVEEERRCILKMERVEKRWEERGREEKGENKNE